VQANLIRQLTVPLGIAASLGLRINVKILLTAIRINVTYMVVISISNCAFMLYGLEMALNSAMRTMRPGSNPGLPRATSRLFARAPGRVAYRVSGGFPFTNCMCIPTCGARLKL
jgi:hypothetical protein